MGRKAFTLVEIIIALVIASVIATYVMQQKNKNAFYDDINDFLNTIEGIINVGITDSVVGYPRGDGDSTNACGDSTDYTSITASRVVNCAGWTSKFDIEGTNTSFLELNGARNYIEGTNLFAQYTDDGAGCKIYIDEDGSDKTIFIIYIDCSNVNYGQQDRYKKLVEERIASFIQTKYSLKVDTMVRDATSLTSTVGGEEDDGKLRFSIKN
jgi:prepilin-type N-terminal cleavage/methylation domain-containing protein